MEGGDGVASRSDSNDIVPAQLSQGQALAAVDSDRSPELAASASLLPTEPPGATVVDAALSNGAASVTASCRPDPPAAVLPDADSSADPLLQDDAECLSDGSDGVADALVKGICDPDDNLPKPRRFRTKSRTANRSRTGSRLSATIGSNSDVASSGFGSRLSFKRPLPSRQTSTMSRASRASGASAKSGVSMLSRASGTSVMSQLTAHESCGFLHISNDIGSMLGSAIMLTSPSYLDVYQSSYLNLADQLQLPVDDELALSQDAVVGGGGLTKIAEEPEDFDSIAQTELVAASSAQTDSGPASVVQQLRASAGGELPAKAGAKAVQRMCYKRIVWMALAFFFVYSAFFSLRNVQSSLAKDSSLGLLSLGCLYALPWLGAVCSYPIMHRIRPKWTLVCATVPYLLFALSNFHAAAYLALPASLVQGFGLGLIWAAEGLYMVNTASTYAIVTGVPLNQAIGKFNSVFYAIYQSSNVVGNGLSSLILQSVFPGEAPPVLLQPLPPQSWANVSTTAVAVLNVTGDTVMVTSEALTAGTTTSMLRPANVTAFTCGIMFDFSQKLSGSPISPAQKYTLLSVMTFMASAGLLVAIFLVKKLDVAHLTGARNVFISFRNMLRIIVDPRMLLLFPVFVYFGFSGSLMFGDYAKAFISCRYGASKIGLVFLVGAAVGVLGSLTSGMIANYTGRAPVIVVAGLVASGAYITMLFWTPPEGGVSFLLFLPVVMWCFSDGILSSQINGFQGFLFQEKLPSACAAYLLCYGCSVAIGTMTAAFEWMTLQVKTYLVICMQVAALTSYVFIEGLLRRGVLQQG